MSKILYVFGLLTIMLTNSVQAAPQGPVVIVAIQPAQPSSGCAFFQVKGGAHGQWIALDTRDLAAIFNTEMSVVISSFYSSMPIMFDTAGTVCGYPKLSWLSVGTQN